MIGKKKKISHDEEKYEYIIHIKGREQRKKKNKVSVHHYYNLNFFVIHNVFKNNQIRRYLYDTPQ